MGKNVKKVHVDTNKQYNFPAKLRVVNFAGKFIVVAEDFANWIVLDNEFQLSFFELLKVHPLKKALDVFTGEYADAVSVVTQIEARHLENKEVVSGVPTRLHLYLTNKCNMRCPHCYMYAGKENKNELKTEEVFSILRNYSKKGGIYLTLSGGEVSLRKDLLEICKYAYDCNLKLQIMTNGTLWFKDLVDEISKYIQSVQISIDGYDEESNSLVRGVGNFDKAVSSIELFLANKIKVEVAVTPMYADDMELLIDKYATWGRELIAKYGEYGLVVKFSGEMIDGREVKLTEEQQSRYSIAISKIYEECYGCSGDGPFIDNIKSGGLMDNCSYGNLTISSVGDVYFCGRIEGLNVVANVRNESWDKIWDLSVLAKEISNVSNVEPCCDCEIKYICGGDCRIKYFEALKSDDIQSFGDGKRPKRKCEEAVKKHFYELMVRTNEKLYQ